ncbi:uncharacterized protein PV09_00334 [Verruconis gallopava]|uniref:Uncharacterized protein n=1 Tax=Verruconis gallopava TaxID=253628 RepID=A0A0D2BDF1_9PEZI|nr:uncharacterized protein PV09_00334 [Verruconis gallopava]KIW09454.1 hypothetical protein PV09_00334 [Verruconis gallopava]
MASIIPPHMHGDATTARKFRWNMLKNMARDWDQARAAKAERASTPNTQAGPASRLPIIRVDGSQGSEAAARDEQGDGSQRRRSSRLSMLGRSLTRSAKAEPTEEEAFFETARRCELNESRLASAFRRRGLYDFHNLLVRTLNGDTAWLPTGAVVDPRHPDYPVDKDVAEFVCQLCLIDGDGRYFDLRLDADRRAKMVRYWLSRGGREHTMPALRTERGSLGAVQDFHVDLKQWRS